MLKVEAVVTECATRVRLEDTGCERCGEATWACMNALWPEGRSARKRGEPFRVPCTTFVRLL